MKEKIIDFLLKNADTSIVLRVKKEILNYLSDKEEKELITKIIKQKNIQTILQSQKQDGWFGNNFHGQSPKLGSGMYDNMEVGLRYLIEKGFSPENKYIKKAINSFLLREPFDYITYRVKPPMPPATDYTYTASGLYLARSSIIIRAGYEYLFPENDFIHLKHDIDFSFKTFSNVLNYATVDDVLDTHRKKLCFKPDVLWPCLYDLRMLAYSDGWRDKKNISLLANSINQLFSFPRSDEMVYTYIKGQYKGPCFAFIHSQGKILDIKDNGYVNLNIMELFARCGIIGQVKVLKNMYEVLIAFIDDNLDINFRVNKNEGYGWSPYFGFALEKNWKTKTKLQCDLLFRILLIIYYVEDKNREK
jgi:hypothetical protein